MKYDLRISVKDYRRDKNLKIQLAQLSFSSSRQKGPVSLRSRGKPGERELVLRLPPGGQGELVLPQDEVVDLPAASPAPAGHRRFQLTPGGAVTLRLKNV